MIVRAAAATGERLIGFVGDRTPNEQVRTGPSLRAQDDNLFLAPNAES